MKATSDIPDALYRKANATAAERGVCLEDLVTDALREHLQRGHSDSLKSKPSAPPWLSAFGGLRHLHTETEKVNRILQREFEQIEEEEWR